MIRFKSNKQILIMTALVIMLCLACLTGATLALFTSDPNDGTIGIITTAGDVEVDIVDTSDESLVNKTLAFMTTSGAVDGDSVMFEPGLIVYTQGFEVKNEGNIPINFRLLISREGDFDREEFDKAFELWLVEATNPDFENATKITEFSGRLERNENSTTYHLIIRMKETVGNEFQYKSYSGIGITVYATQGNVDVRSGE